ncbi:MAG TPA: hypothetical protein PK735_03650, partial [Flavobacteriales bacterium]|nr:hypothetical protein [Flavobacteriales bacterium]
ILIPLWASAWFIYLASHAIWMLSWVLLPRVPPQDIAHIEWRAAMAAIWLVLIAIGFDCMGIRINFPWFG